MRPSSWPGGLSHSGVREVGPRGVRSLQEPDHRLRRLLRARRAACRLHAGRRSSELWFDDAYGDRAPRSSQCIAHFNREMCDFVRIPKGGRTFVRRTNANVGSGSWSYENRVFTHPGSIATERSRHQVRSLPGSSWLIDAENLFRQPGPPQPSSRRRSDLLDHRSVDYSPPLI
jgi:hypothetical protein